MSILIDRIEGASITEERGQIIEATRVAIVTGQISGADMGKRVLALSGMPKYTDTYFGDTAVTLISRRWAANSQQDGGTVELVYKRRSNAEQDEPATTALLGISGGTTTREITTEKDRDGNVIKVQPPAVDGPLDVEQTGEVSILRPQRFLNIKRTVTTNSPGDITDRFVGKISGGGFEGKAQGEWLCVDAPFDLISVDPVTGSKTWEINFQLQHSEDGWQPTIAYRDNKNNRLDDRIPADGSAGIAKVNAYFETDLNAIYNV
jgi:hypothetical protein